MQITPQDLQAAQILLDFNALREKLAPADAIFILGSNDLNSAFRGGQLFLDGWAPQIIVSGNVGRSSINSAAFNRPEAEIFADYLIEMGVPTDKILIENQATNTGENIEFSLKLIKEKGLAWRKLLLVQAPYMQRRSMAAIRYTNPELEVISAPPLLPFSTYPNAELPLQHLIEMLVADTQRLDLYHQKGWLIKTEIPQEVTAAYNYLKNRGFTKYLIAE